MILRLLCPSGHVLDVDAQLAGRKVRCGACGKIMLVPALPARGAVKKPPPKPPPKPISKLPPRPDAAPPDELVPAPIIVPPRPAPPLESRPAPPLPIAPPPILLPPISAPSAERPPAEPPSMTREPDMVAIPLPPVVKPEEEASTPEVEEDIPRRPGMVAALLGLLRGMLPRVEQHLPDDAAKPDDSDRQTARQLAAAVASTAVLGLLPVALSSRLNLFSAPPWAIVLVFLAAIQLVFAAWMVNAPDWAAARVQMIISAAATTIYGMVLTLVLISPRNQTLILGLSDVRRMAPAWSGLMFFVMAAATWYCGRTAALWRAK